MTTKYYQCHFLSDIILPASSNTQGNVMMNDFIGGSNFLGMVATAYESFGADAFDLFHSGAVRFGDGHLLVDGKPSLKMPLSFYSTKTSQETYNRLHLYADEERQLRQEQKQLKQHRHGYIDEHFNLSFPTYNYTQKSAYDKIERHSKEGGMFGYSALPKGTQWHFEIQYEEERFVALVEHYLLGKKRLGKSKTAQYGQVEIVSSALENRPEVFSPEEGLSYLYLKSRAALVDETGNPTLIPTIANLGLHSGEIVWEKCYLKSSTYHPYNYKRATKEYTRLCLNKGSVITLRNVEEPLPETLGVFLSEGFGQLLVNPAFLKPKQITLTACQPKRNKPVSGHFDTKLVNYLQNREQSEQQRFDVADDVQKIFTQLIGPSRSQWGVIRALASTAKESEALIQEIANYIDHGVEKKQWKQKDTLLYSAIRNSADPIAFTKLLSMIVAKHTEGVQE